MKHERTLRVYNSLGYDSSQPLIRLQGKWVRDAGFQPGDYLKIDVQDKIIVIRNMELEESSVDDQE